MPHFNSFDYERSPKQEDITKSIAKFVGLILGLLIGGIGGGVFFGLVGVLGGLGVGIIAGPVIGWLAATIRISFSRPRTQEIDKRDNYQEESANTAPLKANSHSRMASALDAKSREAQESIEIETMPSLLREPFKPDAPVDLQDQKGYNQQSGL